MPAAVRRGGARVLADAALRAGFAGGAADVGGEGARSTRQALLLAALWLVLAGGAEEAVRNVRRPLVGHVGAGGALVWEDGSLGAEIAGPAGATAVGGEVVRRAPVVTLGAEPVAAGQVADDLADVRHPRSERAVPR